MNFSLARHVRPSAAQPLGQRLRLLRDAVGNEARGRSEHPIVRGREVDSGALVDDARGVDAEDAVVAAIDVPEIYGLGDTGHLVKFARVAPLVRVFDQAALVALVYAIIPTACISDS